MQYRMNPKNGDKLSALAFGCMRLPKSEAECEAQILRAIELGVNYFDTAYIYSGSEEKLGRILAKNQVRDKVFLATKLPQAYVNKEADFERYFALELSHLQTTWIDYYLMHILTSYLRWNKLVELGVLDFIKAKKASGQIKNIGFSFHGHKEEFIKILDAYDWDFCMIQFNYLDENVQASKEGLRYAGKKGIPVMVMEPLRGGTLVNKLPPKAKKLWDEAGTYSYAARGLRFVLHHKEVLSVLSGMNSLDMIEENAKTAEDAKINGLSDKELALYQKAAQLIRQETLVGCTGCGYCLPCPQSVDIPACFACLNDTKLHSHSYALKWYALLVKDNNASRCVRCGLCESKCPQHIEIRQKLALTKKKLERFPYKLVRYFVRRFMEAH